MIKQLVLENTRVFIKHKALYLCGAIYAGIAVVLTLVIAIYSPDNPSLNTSTSSNFVYDLLPVFTLSDVLHQFFGLSAYIIPMYFLVSGIRLMRINSVARPFKRIFLLLVLSSCLAGVLDYAGINYSVIGHFVSTELNTIPNFKYDKTLIFSVLTVLSAYLLVYVFELSMKQIAEKILSMAKMPAIKVAINDSNDDLPPEVQDSRKRFKKKILNTIHVTKQRKLDESSIYMLPPLELLKMKEQQENKVSKNYYSEKSALLLQTLNDFGVTGKIVGVSSGPVVSLFLFEPSAGIKAARIVSLASDIARSISAKSVRVSVVPGKSVIGIEVPNDKRETVYLRELLTTKEFEKFPAPLAIALGKSIDGEPVVVDLAQMPHLLVAGTTGSGKSVAINTMILSLLYRLSPESCKLILIDPKMLELSVYEGIPHLLTPVVTESKKAVSALKWAVREMERRYQIMSKIGVRNIYGYNEKVTLAMKSGQKIYREMQVGFDENSKPIIEKEYLENEIFPNIVIVVDEMADLMMVAGKDIECAVQRLAQMARAAGIHLIMATQRPSVDVITGTIKANFPTRISFHVSSKIDSRTILGEQGAEHLLGMGDMLYMANASSITRVHGPFVSDSEIEAVVKYLQAQSSNYKCIDIELDSPDGSGEALGEFDNEDAMYKEALTLMRREGKISTSFIQRHLKIGYNRAARIVDQMEANGIISEPDHVGRRRIVG